MTNHHDEAIILIAHGSRRPQANAELFEVAKRLQDKCLRRVYPAFLELAEPSIVHAGSQAIADGASRIVLLPYFLSAGRHAIEDLEKARAEIASHHKDASIYLAEPLGPHPLLEAILCERFENALP